MRKFLTLVLHLIKNLLQSFRLMRAGLTNSPNGSISIHFELAVSDGSLTTHLGGDQALLHRSLQICNLAVSEKRKKVMH